MLASPHDALFKAVLGQSEHARGALRTIVPAALAEALDWSTLTLRPGSFVDAALTHQHTDLLYSARWHDGDNDAVAYLLFEHQSAPPTDGPMAHRLLRYQGRIWDSWRTDRPRAKTLPMIIPIVMYHGVTPWSEARSFDALLDVPPVLRPEVEPYLVRFAYLLFDLSKISDDELRQNAQTALTKLTLMALKHARMNVNMLEVLERWKDIAREVAMAPNGREALEQVMRYILEVNEHLTLEALQAFLEREIGPEAKDTVMTTGQQLIQQGIQQGLQQGIQQGRQRFQELLLHLLRQRFGNEVDAHVEQRIATASIEEIETWSGRILSAATLAKVFAD
jgi:predicted transposase/invertase (TIGR01784 family)